ncbi:MAG: glutathione S-transferase [Candidatus Azotimanducaceae bacterium]|jgi:glutathione S-transferase
MLALIELSYFGVRVGGLRATVDIQAPATTGNEFFERYYRVHYNTIEQLMVFLPGLWALGYFVSEPWSAGIGSILLVGRIIYFVIYIKDTAKRGLGMALSLFPGWILVIGGLIGAILALVSKYTVCLASSQALMKVSNCRTCLIFGKRNFVRSTCASQTGL